MPLYESSHNLLNGLVQIANKMGLQNKTQVAEAWLPVYSEWVELGKTCDAVISIKATLLVQ
jgi:hypothetical protein